MGDVPGQDLADLLDGPFHIGAVVPLVRDEYGRVVEAGTYHTGGGRVAGFDHGTSPADPAHAFRRDIPGTRSPVIAVTGLALAGLDLTGTSGAEGAGGASGGENTVGGVGGENTVGSVGGENTVGGVGGVDEALATIQKVVAHVLAQGLRLVYEPAWHVPAIPGTPVAAAPAGPRRWADRDEACPVRVLVVTGTVPGTLVGANGLASLVEDLGRCPQARVTLACADGFGANEHAAHFQRHGVEVAAGPQDWLAWCADRRYHYSHVIVSDEGLTTRLWPIVRSTQPQAMAIVYSEQLPLRRVQAAGQAGPHVEGAETVAEIFHGRLLRQLDGIEAAWCASAADASLLAGLGTSISVQHTFGPPIPHALSVPGKGFADRDGVALVAVDSFDVASDAEDAVLRALDEVVPAWRRRDIGLVVKVISDWPTPGLVEAASKVGAELLRSRGDLVAALSAVRLAVSPVEHGSSTLSWAPAALAAGTPWLSTAKAVAGTFLEGGPAPAVVDDTATLSQRGWALLTDEVQWREFAGTLVELRARLGAERSRALAAALVSAGLDVPGAPLWPVPPLVARPATPPARVPLRPAALADPPAIFVPDSLTEDLRYELWHERRGPGNPEVVASIAAEAASAAYQPTISVLVPVCDTEPWMLDAAAGSVFAQGYANWELCLADDASRHPETLAALESLAERDPRVKLVHLDERSGIAAATNAALGLATGEFVGFLDHDDLLKPHALAQVVRWLGAGPDLDLLYSDEDKLTPEGRMTEARWKPDWSPNLLLSQNYVCHFLVVRRALVNRLGGLRPEFDGSQDYDLILRVADATDRIAHIPDCLYSWRMHAQSTAAAGDKKPFAWLAAQRALGDWLRRREARGGAGGWTEEGAWFDVHRTRFRRLGEPKVSIIIPTRNARHLLGRCIESVVARTVYSNYELVVVDNQSDDPETLEYLATLPGEVVRYPHQFNFPRQINLAAAAVQSDLLVFLNNDTEVLTTDWLDRLVEQAMRPEIGAVGPRLLLPNGEVQHEGIMIGLWRGHANSIEWGNWWRMGDLPRDVSAVTGACMATRPGVFWRVGGYDERLRVAYNDVDYCLRLHQAGYQVVYEPDAALFHAEGSTRGRVEDPHDAPLFDRRWRPRSSCDPYYNPNLNRNRLLFRVEP